MKAIAALITWISSRFTGWIAGTFAAKWGTTAVLISLQVSIFAVALGGIGALVSGISMVVNDDLSRAMSWFVPSNTLPCMASLFSAYVIRTTFEFHSSLVRIWANAL